MYDDANRPLHGKRLGTPKTWTLRMDFGPRMQNACAVTSSQSDPKPYSCPHPLSLTIAERCRMVVFCSSNRKHNADRLSFCVDTTLTVGSRFTYLIMYYHYCIGITQPPATIPAPNSSAVLVVTMYSPCALFNTLMEGQLPQSSAEYSSP